MDRNCSIQYYFLFLLAGLSLMACRNTSEDADPEMVEAGAEENRLREVIPGTWEGVSMKVNVYSANGIADSSFVFQVNDGDWENLFSVLPPRTYFERNNKYRIEYRDRRDSVMSTSRGIWNVMGDTLMMIEPDQTQQYQVRYDKGMLFFIGQRDWDEDGVEDDAYQEVKRRVSIGTEK